ncbi:MAG TPA: RNA polymerase sigma factor [Candidatus Ozemobacteraceae bacterium]|nr:RNA polymerase sigma factor [Candidatus Ozemobacteraceae bacterium]
MNDVEALTLARQGRQEGFKAIWETYGRYLYTLAFRLLRDRALAEDASQEAFSAAFRSIDGFRGDCRLKTWLYRILYRAVLRIQDRHQHGNGVCEVPESFATSGNRHEELESRLDVRDILDRLPERDRAILIMAYWDDLTCAEIAEVLSTNANHVKILLFRARERFARLWPDREAGQAEERAS